VSHDTPGPASYAPHNSQLSKTGHGGVIGTEKRKDKNIDSVPGPGDYTLPIVTDKGP
jgi:hypothetical protein